MLSESDSELRLLSTLNWPKCSSFRGDEKISRENVSDINLGQKGNGKGMKEEKESAIGDEDYFAELRDLIDLI